MQIEVWSDVVCPWCYIGRRRLQRALAEGPTDVTVTHRAFQLDPTARTEGQRTVDVLAAKYGTSVPAVREMMAHVTSIAAGEGLEYHLDRTISGSTRDAHRLLLWAQDQGSADGLLDELYAGYFTRGEPVFAVDELVPFVERAGLDAAAARAMLASDAFVDAVTQDQDLAARFGANGVPFFVFDRRYGISGAQPLEVFTATLAQAAADAQPA
jgi:predicted DsbA family dithiol-disulfide isomerase